HPGRAGAGPARRAPHRQGPALVPGAPGVSAPGAAGRDRPKRRSSGLGALLAGGETSAEDLAELEAKLFYDTEPGIDPYVRFGVLLVASTVIATGGVLSDATATVVGAMIVAPLMVPILAAALAIVTGDLARM